MLEAQGALGPRMDVSNSRARPGPRLPAATAPGCPAHWPWRGSSHAPALSPPELYTRCFTCLERPSTLFPWLTPTRPSGLPNSNQPPAPLLPPTAFLPLTIPSHTRLLHSLLAPPTTHTPPLAASGPAPSTRPRPPRARTHGSSPGASSAWGGSRRTWAPPSPRGTRRSLSRCTGRARSRSGCSYILHGHAHGVRPERLVGAVRLALQPARPRIPPRRVSALRRRRSPRLDGGWGLSGVSRS